VNKSEKKKKKAFLHFFCHIQLFNAARIATQFPTPDYYKPVKMYSDNPSDLIRKQHA
jgi:hypothetical protein